MTLSTPTGNLSTKGRLTKFLTSNLPSFNDGKLKLYFIHNAGSLQSISPKYIHIQYTFLKRMSDF